MALEKLGQKTQGAISPIQSDVFGMSISRTDLQRAALFEENQDAFYVENGIAAVFDGVGISTTPAFTSRTAALVLQDSWRKIFDQKHEIQEVEEAMRNMFKEIQDVLWVINPDAERIATTGVIGRIWRDINSQVLITIGHLGDSRAYAYKKRHGTAQPLTVDHCPLHDTVQSFLNPHELGKILDFQRAIDTVETEEDCLAVFRQYLPFKVFREDNVRKFVKWKNRISRFLGYSKKDRLSGRDDDTPTLYTETVAPGDEYYFTTDGVHANVPPDRLETILAARVPFRQKTNMLIEAIKKYVASHGVFKHYDDATFVALAPRN